MGAKETNIVNDVMLEASNYGARLWRNTRGHFYTLDSVKYLISAIKSTKWSQIMEAMQNLRQVKAGLQAVGSSDLIGFRPITITQDMVGKILPVFSVIEVKTETGVVSQEQMQFINFILKNGGFAGVARSVDTAKKILNIPLDVAQ